MTRKILLSIIIVVILSFSACELNSDVIYTGDDNNNYIIVRDENGNITINDNGKLQVYTLNENNKKQKSDSGEYITKFIDFNGQVVIDNTVETAELTFTLPDKFIADKDNVGYFYCESYDAEIFFNYYNEDIQTNIDSIIHNCENLLESFGSENFKYEQYSVVIDGDECTAFKHKSTSSEYYRNAYYYIIPYDTGYYEINCIINTDDANKVNFDKFVQTINIK